MEDYRVLNTPKPEVRISELADSSVNLVIGAWAPKDQCWEAYYENFERINVALDTRHE